MSEKTTIAEYSETEAQLAELRQQLAGVVFDCSTPEGFKEAKDSRMMLVRCRTSLESIRKEIKEPALKRCQEIDTEARRITGEIEKLEAPIIKQIQLEEVRQAESKRKAEEAARREAEKWVNAIEKIKMRPLDFINAGPAEVFDALEKARAAKPAKVPAFPAELQGQAEAAFSGAIAQLEQMHIAALDREETAARLKRYEQESGQSGIADADVIPNEASSAGPTPSPAVQSVSVKTAPTTTSAAPQGATTEPPPASDASLAGERSEPPFEPDPEPAPYAALLEAAEAVYAHYNKFKKPHGTIVALGQAIEAVKAV